MDAKTRNERRKLKAQRTPRGELSNFEPRGLGRKLKSAETFPTQICSHIEGGTPIYLKRRRKTDNSVYNVRIVKGGIRCPNPVLHKGKCLDHLG
jgi:hypothetical protein